MGADTTKAPLEEFDLDGIVFDSQTFGQIDPFDNSSKPVQRFRLKTNDGKPLQFNEEPIWLLVQGQRIVNNGEYVQGIGSHVYEDYGERSEGGWYSNVATMTVFESEGGKELGKYNPPGIVIFD